MRATWVIVVAVLAPLRVEGAAVTVDTPVGLPGEDVEVAVRLALDGEEVAGILTEFSFDPAVPVASADSGGPDCAPLEGAIFGAVYRPASCTVGVDCRGVFAGILSFEGLFSEGILFRCRVTIPADTPVDTSFPLDVIQGIVSDPEFMETDVTEESQDGGVLVVGEPLCLGDCDGDGSVNVAEIVTGIDRALTRDRPGCALSDRQGDGTVDLSELVAAVANSLAGCPTREMRAVEREVVALPPSAPATDR